MVAQRVAQHIELGGPRRPGENKPEAMSKARLSRCATFGEHALGDEAGCFKERHIVHQVEGLQRRVGAVFTHYAGFAIGRVEGGHHGRGDGSFPKSIKAAAICIGSFSLRVVHVLHHYFLPKSGGLIGFHRGASQLFR